MQVRYSLLDSDRLNVLKSYLMAKQTICTFPTLILKWYFFQELFPFSTAKTIPFHAKFNENNVYFFPIICS